MNTQLLENSILENLSILKYPFTIEDNKIFVRGHNNSKNDISFDVNFEFIKK